MPGKGFSLEVTLDIHCVTCPGVWLCPSGTVSLDLYLLNATTRTPPTRPSFPIRCQERYIFNKTFYTKHSLSDLQKVLDKEKLYIELIQWENCEDGNVLAVFQTTLKELLYPSLQCGTSIGTDVDLLMEPVKNFPGIIAPKIEVSTMSKIEEVVNTQKDSQFDKSIVNHKVITSNKIPKKNKRRQKKVCHSMCHRNDKYEENDCSKNRPPFVVRHCNEDSIMRQPGFALDCDKSVCNMCKIKSDNSNESLTNKEQKCSSKTKMNDSNEKCTHSSTTFDTIKRQKKHRKIRQAWCDVGDEDGGHKVDDTNVTVCKCRSNHSSNNCHVCHQYSKYFNTKPQRSQYTLHSRKTNARCNIFNQPGDGALNSQCDVCVSEFCKSEFSLAKKIHERLKGTLSTAKSYPLLSNCNCEDEDDDSEFSDIEDLGNGKNQCCCSYIKRNCTKEDIKVNIDNIYRKFRRGVNSKRKLLCS